MSRAPSLPRHWLWPPSLSFPSNPICPQLLWTLMSDQGRGYLQSPAQRESTLPVHGKKEEGRGAEGGLLAANLKGSPGESGGKGDAPSGLGIQLTQTAGEGCAPPYAYKQKWPSKWKHIVQV